jgi:hypothetical protein
MEFTEQEIKEFEFRDFPFPSNVIENTIKTLNKALLLRHEQITREEFKARVKRILFYYRELILRIGLLNEILDDGKENVFISDCINNELSLVAAWPEEKDPELASYTRLPGVYEMFLAGKTPHEKS